MTIPKSYWSILKTFLNNKKYLLFLHYYTIINSPQTCKKGWNIWQFFCSLISTNSYLSSVLSKETPKLLATIYFTSDDILKIVKNFGPNKTHGHDMISIQMIKNCDASTCKPLELIFWSCLDNGKFPSEWKKLTWFQHPKKEINKTWKTTVQYLCFRLLEKYLKEYCIITCSS